MKKITLFFFFLFAVSFVHAQVDTAAVMRQYYLNHSYLHGDSAYLDGRYYSPADYPAAKALYDRNHYETWFMPGAAYSYYQPNATDSLGHFSGLSVEYLIYAHVHNDDNPGPSHVRIYSTLNILKSDKKSISSMFRYAMGLDLSLEKNPKRSFLVPYFGLEIGAFSQKQLGTTMQFTPTFGIHLLSKKNIYINAFGGYVYPIHNFDYLQGWFAQGGVNFAVW